MSVAWPSSGAERPREWRNAIKSRSLSYLAHPQLMMAKTFQILRVTKCLLHSCSIFNSYLALAC